MKTIDETFGKLTINQSRCQSSTSNIVSITKSETPHKASSGKLILNSQELQLQEKALQETKEKIRLTDLTSSLFNFLGEYYGNSWTQGLERISYEGRLSTWMDSLGGLTQDQLDYAKRKISSGECHPTYPPTPGEFRNLCKSKPEYVQAEPVPQAQYHQKPSTNIREEFEFWYRGLKAEQKTKVYEGAVKAWPAFAGLLKQTKESYLETGFEKSVWFTRMVDAFMGYYKIASLRDLR